ncbi:HIT domain-containing protein [Acidianus sp. HS-5]|uniref:HIT family protein n=1 Tax=Acidianus sp. HS-5 TaxID=2886040 RepID=UPI001F249759|nr:HIT domain-containing protein [Acidianus sp. HS-5]BDC19255.1 HIT family hydrolase [Acidianus sp. HS-5]
MDFLWAPWRSKYVADSSKSKKEEGFCIFCEFPKQNLDEKNLIVYRSRHAYIILNRFPYNPGHVMIVPYRHVSSIDLLDNNEAQDVFRLIKITLSSIRKIYSPDGFNIGINIGRTAGAGIEAHVHVHIVPRWNGDANFMPVLSNTKVLPEDLDTTYAKLKKTINDIISNEDSLDH